MKTIKLGPIEDFEGNPILNGEEPFTLKQVFMNVLGRSNPEEDGEATLNAYAVGLKIGACKGADIELEDAEIGIIKKAIEFNGPGYIRLIKAPALLAVS